MKTLLLLALIAICGCRQPAPKPTVRYPMREYTVRFADGSKGTIHAERCLLGEDWGTHYAQFVVGPNDSIIAIVNNYYSVEEH